MSRQRADLVAASVGSSRQDMWAQIRRLKQFTVIEVCGRLRIDSARAYMRGLEAAGYVERIGTAPGLVGERGRRVVFKLVNDVGVHAPRVRETGEAVTQGAARDQMWRTMRILKEFNWRELALQASTEEQPVDPEDAKSYTKYLWRAGYLRLMEPGTGPIAARYRLMPSRYTGPKSPQVQRVHQVFDRNLNKVVWFQGGGNVW